MNDRNLAALLRRQAERLGPCTALRFQRHGIYHDVSWQRYRADASACAAGLVEAGIAPGDRVGLLAENRLEWLIADMGIMTAGAVNVPPHAPLTARQVAYQLADAGCRWLFVSTREQLEKISQVLPELPGIRGIVVFDALDLKALSSDHSPASLISWNSFLHRGRKSLTSISAELTRRENALGPDDLATIMYTSGTTGNPKGVMLTHGNLISNALAIQEVQPRCPDDMLLSWLPYSHIYARTVDHYLSLVAGVALSLAESAETVVRNLDDVHPTHLSAVPRFYEKVMTSVASDDPAKTARRLRDIFGPRIDWLTSGGAPLPLPVARAYCDAGLLLLQGYGLTETSPVISFNRREKFKLDSVGLPLPGVEVKIATDGEVLTRGPHVMKGYWNNPEATAEAIREGWFHTGDLGRLDEDGFLFITGRKKELMVLSNGKKVVPNFIEGLLVADECIDQAVVCGEGRNFLTALIVPHWENVRRGLAVDGLSLDGTSEEDLARRSELQAFLKRRIAAALVDVSSWEQVRKFLVLPAPFTVAADEMTVSLKLKRNVVLAKYGDALERLYRE